MEFFHYDNHLGAYAPLILSLIFWMIAFDRLDRKKVEHRLFVISIISFLTLHYLIWRIAYTVVPVSLGSFQGIWIWVCFAAELLALLEYAVFYLNMSGLTDRHKEADIHEQHLRSRKKKDLPNVDVFITTYNEGIEVVERTILGALHLDWPKDKLKVYVLDDGHRDWLRDYTLSKGALYISRENNEHFKAGNINNALKKTDGDFIVVLDADFVPFRQFIYRTLGFMEDKNVGIVQTPQCFFNHDYIQSNLHLHTEASDDQRIFFDHMMESRDGWDAAFWCGSCSIVRREAIESIGGVPTDSVTEDILTTLVLLRKGYVTRYLTEKLSHGLAPESVHGLITQRKRWCRGSIQSLFLKWGSLGPGMPFVHRVLFFPIYWIAQPVVRFMILFTPIVFFLTGITPIVVNHYTDLIYYQVPLLVFNISTSFWMLPQHFVPFLTDASASLHGIQLIPTVFKTFFKPFGEKFRVTPKGKLNEKVKRHTFAFYTSLTLFVLTIVGIIINLSPTLSPIPLDSFFPVAVTMALFNVIILTLMIFMSIEHPRHREHERFPVNEKSDIRMDGKVIQGMIIDLSIGGASFHCDSDDVLSEHQKIQLRIPENDQLELVNCEVVSYRNQRAFLKFDDLDHHMRDEIIRHIFTGRYDNSPKKRDIMKIIKRILRRTFHHHRDLQQSHHHHH